ncbi:hypothetical protein COLO4_26040 [Corchorus olitorius]|uniref:Uncharacterized protein n=1 Tax=Corchorus olitorius TaxID=93759 RepID=A0A1R3HZ91_9ROSI|nr:hypothetical protein COLO4_26040 [Corchorus olitorius]
MEVEDDTREGSVSSVILESLESIQKGDKLSAADLAWVDSCLVTDTEILESNWTSFKDVLLEIIGDNSELVMSSASESDGFVGGTEIEIVPSIEEAETANYSGRTEDDLAVIPIDGDDETNTSNDRIKRRIGITFKGDPFLPTYNEDEVWGEATDLGLDMNISAIEAIETNPSTVDIFRVWDLDIPAEEDDLIKQLNKAITETSTESVPSAFDDSMAWKDLKDEPLDNLIAAIADLSLDKSSS